MDLETVKEICIADLGLPLLDTSAPAPISILPEVSSFTSDIYSDDAYFVMNDLMHKEIVSAVVQLKSVQLPDENAARHISLWKVRLTTGVTLFIQVTENGVHRTLQGRGTWHQKLLIYAVADETFAGFVYDYAVASYTGYVRTIMSILIELIGDGFRSLTDGMPANQAESWRSSLVADASKALSFATVSPSS
jgi:hypothetical protein